MITQKFTKSHNKYCRQQVNLKSSQNNEKEPQRIKVQQTSHTQDNKIQHAQLNNTKIRQGIEKTSVTKEYTVFEREGKQSLLQTVITMNCDEGQGRV